MGSLTRRQADPNNPAHVCMRCLAMKSSASSLEAHMWLYKWGAHPLCDAHRQTKWLKVRNYWRKLKRMFRYLRQFWVANSFQFSVKINRLLDMRLESWRSTAAPTYIIELVLTIHILQKSIITGVQVLLAPWITFLTLYRRNMMI